MMCCPAALARTQMGRTNLADNGDFNYGDTTFRELTCPSIVIHSTVQQLKMFILYVLCDTWKPKESLAPVQYTAHC